MEMYKFQHFFFFFSVQGQICNLLEKVIPRCLCLNPPFGRGHWHDPFAWWRHQMETFSTLLAIYEGNSPVYGEFPVQRPETWSFDILFDLSLNKPFN